MSNPIALIVDDEPDICELLSITLQRMDIDTRTALDLAEARRLLGAERFDVCLTDMRLTDGTGLQLVEWIQQNKPALPVAVITAHGNMQVAVQALKLGAFDFVSKPVDLNMLRNLVNTALRLGQEETTQTDSGGKELLGNSKSIARVRELIAKVSRSQAPVLISGESGTGKELVARLIHQSGPRSEKPFVPVNCGAIPSELMESEFFGHRKGSFTGAVQDKPGLFRAAGGGTLFLDEIGELPLHMQVKLLRVIQEKAVRPVGESEEVSIDVRILSATHRNLDQLVADGRFRKDLYYRINVIELPVPPLRDRGNDIVVLADYLLGRLAQQNGVNAPSLGADARKALLNYRFPGNVRELENILERALTLSEGGEIRASDIQLRDDAETADSDDTTLTAKLGDVEREAIMQALEQARWNKTKAAEILGISFRALRYRIKKLGLE